MFSKEQTAHSLNFKSNLIWLFSSCLLPNMCSLEFSAHLFPYEGQLTWQQVQTYSDERWRWLNISLRKDHLTRVFNHGYRLVDPPTHTCTHTHTHPQAQWILWPWVSFVTRQPWAKTCDFRLNWEEEMQNGWDQTLSSITHLAVKRLWAGKTSDMKEKTKWWFHPHMNLSSCLAAPCLPTYLYSLSTSMCSSLSLLSLLHEHICTRCIIVWVDISSVSIWLRWKLIY